ncbi:MAG: hypothetical protein PF541_15165, partial [Prolixibacteraceae bacterium]|nr:hypothetical protein [Prolixibacteraceae bacterium]
IPRESAFVSMIPSRIYGSLNYNTFTPIDLTLHLSGQLMNRIFRTHLMLLSTYTITPNIRISSGLSMTNRSYLNVPLGVSFSYNNFGFSLSSFNIIGIFAPGYSKNFGGSFGLKYRLSTNDKTKNYKKIEPTTPYYQPLERTRVTGRLF